MKSESQGTPTSGAAANRADGQQLKLRTTHSRQGLRPAELLVQLVQLCLCSRHRVAGRLRA